MLSLLVGTLAGVVFGLAVGALTSLVWGILVGVLAFVGASIAINLRIKKRMEQIFMGVQQKVEACQVQFAYLTRGQWTAEHDVERDGVPEAVRVVGTVGTGTDALPLCTVFRLALAANRKSDGDDKESQDTVPRT